MAPSGQNSNEQSPADLNGVFVHLLHILVSLYAYNEVVIQQHYDRKPVYFFAHPWFLLGILVDILGILRYSTDKFNLAKFQMMNIASLFYCTIGVPFLAAHYHLINGMPLKVAYAHLFLAILPYVLFRRRKYGPLYEVTRYTIILACVSGLFGALVSIHVLAFLAFFLILYAVERIGTGPETHKNLSMYHWFMLYLCLVNVSMALSQSPLNNIYEITPQIVSDTLKYTRYQVLRTPPVTLFRGMMGRGSDNTKETKLLYAELKDNGWDMDERVSRQAKRVGFNEDDDDELATGKGKHGKSKRGKGPKGKKGKTAVIMEPKGKTGMSEPNKGKAAGKAVLNQHQKGKAGKQQQLQKLLDDYYADEQETGGFFSYFFGR
ncbi:unnamed protein product [Notodromas monacha]|uniref:Uncharacterized protein n=1 Tax=Notodromas monacha TaxID=399045 RepID=A0A7R9BU59_9CRUS|nr:unnamed protein product [Notodromas monacha]CAG0920190.1 unnamed protein product [Notodromas monacha]